MKNKSLLIGLGILLVIFLPFSINNYGHNAESFKVDQSSVGYYQSNTCDITLLDVISKNTNNENDLIYNNNNYAGLECYGTVTGLDVVNEKFIVSIGTNSSMAFLIQGILWCLIILLIKSNQKAQPTNYLIPIILSFLFTFQHIAESRFYNSSNIYHQTEIEIINYYLISTFLIYFLIFLFFENNLPQRQERLLNFVPYCFLVVGTFNGFNINFYILMVSYFGLKNVIEKQSNHLFNLVYGIFSVAWFFTNRESVTYFDTDKIRGFINSSNNPSSLLFWILTFWLFLNGLNYLFKVGQFQKTLFKQSLLFSGSLIVIFGTFGSIFPLMNFFNFLIFGQNKRGINTLSSISGNTWRGFSSSAESIGEFFAFIILFLFILKFNEKNKIKIHEILFVGIILFGLIRSNNFAAILSTILLLFVFIVYKFAFLNKFRYYIFFFIGFILISGMAFLISRFTYENLSTELLYESALHSNLYENVDNYSKTMLVDSFFNKSNLGTLFLIENSDYSTSLRFLFKSFDGRFNIPFLPNFVAILSLVSVLINRSEMWGIFFAKYSPSTLEAWFGNGPLQMNNYLEKQKVRLDLPESKLESLFLPHSSIWDIMIFFGIFGLLIFLTIMFYSLYKNKKSVHVYLLVFLFINLLKSDSLLYVNSVLLLFVSIFATYKDNDEKKMFSNE